MERTSCAHATLVPHWDNPDNMGKPELATSWTCASCEQEFTPEERERLVAADAERIKRMQKEAAEAEANLARGQGE